MKKATKVLIFVITFLIALVVGLLILTFFVVPSASFGSASVTSIVNDRVVPSNTDLSIDEILEESDPVKILAVGDIMLGRYVETLMNNNGVDYPFEAIRGFLEQGDLVFGNLEGPVLTNHRQTPNGSTVFSFLPRVVDVLRNNHFDIVSIANNHTFDRGVAGYIETRNYLASGNVDFVGHPRDEGFEYGWSEIMNGRRIVFVAFNEAVNSYFDLERAVSTVRAYASDKEAYVVASIHWGLEYQPTSYWKQQDIAHRFVDAGADLVIGHHPHVVQEIEEYNDALIFYSLGNFVFDQYWSKETQEGLAFVLELSDDEEKFSFYPIDLSGSQPKVMNGEVRDAELNSLAERSSESLREEIRNGIVNF